MTAQPKRRVSMVWDRDRHATVAAEGPEQTVVKFDTGYQHAVLTRDLVDLWDAPAAQEAAERQPLAPQSKAPSARKDYTKLRIVVKKEGNPRLPGTKAFTKWAEMIAYIAANPKATVAEVAAKTSYKTGDFNWDLERGNVGMEEVR